MTAHRLYGARTAEAAAVAAAMTEALGQEFEQRESDYLGIYWKARHGEATIRIVSQPDPEGESLEEQFAEYQTLIYVDGGEGLPAIDDHLAGSSAIELLRPRDS